MYCDKCKKEVPDDFLFCPSCGRKPLPSQNESKRGEFELPPIPPSFNRSIPTADLTRSKRQKKLYGYGVTQRSEGSKGTGCLVLALIFLFLSIAFVSGLFITDKLREKSMTESTATAESTTVSENSSAAEKAEKTFSSEKETTAKKKDEKSETKKAASKSEAKTPSQKAKKN